MKKKKIIEQKTKKTMEQTSEDDPGGAESRPFFKKISKIFSRKNSSLGAELASLIEEHDQEGKRIGSEERSIVSNVLNISDVTIRDVMIPRMDIVAIEDNITLPELKRVITDKEHTRIPVFHESLDHIIGFVHIKDLIPIMGMDSNFEVRKILREILYVPPSMKVIDLLAKMRSKRVHIALVLDEYGGTDGLVTLEDLVEEIVGEIEDEHDSSGIHEINPIDNATFEIKARLPIKELEKKLNIKLKSDDESEDFDTVGGLIFFMLGRIPEKGEVAVHPSGIAFEIIEADPRRVKKILVKKSVNE